MGTALAHPCTGSNHRLLPSSPRSSTAGQCAEFRSDLLLQGRHFSLVAPLSLRVFASLEGGVNVRGHSVFDPPTLFPTLRHCFRPLHTLRSPLPSTRLVARLLSGVALPTIPFPFPVPRCRHCFPSSGHLYIHSYFPLPFPLVP